MTAAVAVALTAVACAPASDLPRDAAVEVRGAVLTEDGSPVPGAAAVLVREVGVEEFLSGGLTVLTWGFGCLHDRQLEPCGEGTHRADADGQGRLAFELRGGDVQSGFGTASTMTLTVAGPGRDALQGPATSYAFRVQSTRLELPAHRLWDPPVEVVDGDGAVVATWPDPPADLGPVEDAAALFVDRTGLPVWSAGPGERTDARVLEDAAWAVAAEVRTGATAELRSATYRSAQRPVTGPGAPPSRGAVCAGVSPGRETVRFNPCPLTDGDLVTGFDAWSELPCPDDGAECPELDPAVVVDLGELRALDLLVVRGDDDTLVVQGSADGRTWSAPVAVEVTGGRVAADWSSEPAARYLRVRTEAGTVGTLSEVSAW